jgi:hypothetical protein
MIGQASASRTDGRTWDGLISASVCRRIAEPSIVYACHRSCLAVAILLGVMAGLVPAIYVFLTAARKKDVDARDKRGHDAGEVIRYRRNAP